MQRLGPKIRLASSKLYAFLPAMRPNFRLFSCYLEMKSGIIKAAQALVRYKHADSSKLMTSSALLSHSSSSYLLLILYPCVNYV